MLKSVLESGPTKATKRYSLSASPAAPQHHANATFRDIPPHLSSHYISILPRTSFPTHHTPHTSPYPLPTACHTFLLQEDALNSLHNTSEGVGLSNQPVGRKATGEVEDSSREESRPQPSMFSLAFQHNRHSQCESFFAHYILGSLRTTGGDLVCLKYKNKFSSTS